MEALTSIYTPRVMLEALRQNPRPSTFLRDLFVRRVTSHESAILEIDVVKGGKKLSAYVGRTMNPNQVGKRGFSTNLHTAPYISEEIAYGPQDTRERLPGETVYSGQSPRARLDQKVAGWLMDLEDRLIRREEQQIAEALQTGKIVVTGNGVNYTVDFQMDSDHLVTLTGSDKWNLTGDKIAQIEAWSALTRNAGAPTATDIIMGTDAAALFLKDETVLKYLDNKRVEMGQINPAQIAGQEATFLGSFRRIGLDVNVYSYQAQYDNNGSATPYLDASKVILASRAADFRMHYGPIENLKHGTMVAERFPFMYEDNNGKAGHIVLESSPLFGMHQPDAVVCATIK